jgi:acetyl-CoA/propionyl-CoA carboxylase biotin carboxyl carrier protein
MLWALRRFVILGVTTNIEFLRTVIDDEDFRRGAIHTRFLDERPNLADRMPDDLPDEACIVAARTVQLASRSKATQRSGDGPRAVQPVGPWETAGTWRTV